MVIGYFGIKQPNVFSDQSYLFHKTINTPAEKLSNKQTSNSANDFIDKLQLYMNQKQAYLVPEINLPDLSKQLGVKPSYLSEVLNNELQQNFFDFINKYRIEEFKHQFAKEENKNLSIVGLAYECGFNSKASFYRAFKKSENISPSQFKNKHFGLK